VRAFLKPSVSIRYVSLFLILFGLCGIVIWPATALHFTTVIGGVESTVKSAVAELQGIERALNESYSQLDSVERSLIDFEGRLNTLVDAVNNISSSLATASASIGEISGTLIQASELWELRLVSVDFAEALRNTGESLKGLSKAIQSINLQDFLVELNAVEDIAQVGVQIISFLKNMFKTFSMIVKDIAIRFESLGQTLQIINYISSILALDATLVHLSLALIGFTFRPKRTLHNL